MFEKDVAEQIAVLCKDLKVTQASLANALVKFALGKVDPASLDGLVSAKKRGRKPGSKVTSDVVPEVAPDCEGCDCVTPCE